MLVENVEERELIAMEMEFVIPKRFTGVRTSWRAITTKSRQNMTCPSVNI